MHRKVAAALVAALALAVASCGGSEEETLSGAQLVRRVETACREGTREGRRQAREGAADSRETFITAMIAGQRKQLDVLEDVKATGANKADYEAFKEGVQARIDAMERVAEADRADFESALRAATPAAGAATRRVDEAARSLGATACL